MLNKSTQTILIALCTSAALIGLAFYKRYGGSVNISDDQLFILAALICVLSVLYGLLRCKTWRSKAPKLG